MSKTYRQCRSCGSEVNMNYLVDGQCVWCRSKVMTSKRMIQLSALGKALTECLSLRRPMSVIPLEHPVTGFRIGRRPSRAH